LAFLPETGQPLKKENEMSKEKQVAEKQSTEIAEASSIDSFLAENAGAGTQNFTKDDLALPFLRSLDEGAAMLDTLDGAEAGDMYNSVTLEVYKKDVGIKVIPCFYQKEYIEWAPIGTGSGAPINIYKTLDEAPKTERNHENKDLIVGGGGNYIETTAQHYVLLVTEESASPALISLKSTQLKKSRMWNTLTATAPPIQTANGTAPAPIFTYYYQLSTGAESNLKGRWSGWKILRGEKVDVLAHLKAAHSLATSFEKGEVSIKREQSESSSIDNSDIPF
tara:strand:+ start:2550 stop:3386 length:837 start_codon:yes stop_codon:yes gene_type:complete